MAKTKISQYDATAANNTDIDSISIAEGMAPSNVNNAIRELMAHLKDMDAGTQALTSPQLSSVDINGGSIDGAVIGANSAAAITGTTITGTSLVIGSANINENDFESIDGITAGTVAASKAVIVDANKDVTGFRNVTLTGELDAATLDVSGDIDVDGTSNLDAIDVDGAANFAADVTFADGADIITASAGTSNFRAGVNAGNSIASGGNYNTVVGDEAGTAITTGDNNTLIGYVAGDAISTSSANTAVGSFAMTSMTDGSDNVAVGTSALDVDTKGSYSVAVGRNALGSQNFTSATDTYNTAVGHNAGL